MPLPLKPRQPLLPGQQLLHQPFLPLLAVLKQALGGGDGLIPGGEDLGDLFLFGEGGGVGTLKTSHLVDLSNIEQQLA